MAILNLSELTHHAIKYDYQLPAINVQSLSVLKGIIAWAKKYNVPFIVTIDGDQVENGLIPSIEELLRKEAVASAIIARRVANKHQAVEAIRQGCQALFVNDDCDEQDKVAIEKMAQDCGIISKTDVTIATDFLDIDQYIEFNAVMKEVGQITTWQQLDAAVIKAVMYLLSNIVEQITAKNKATDAKTECKPSMPVEHLIIYNSSVDDEQTRKAAQIGVDVLDKIPGVRATWRGEAVKSEAQYQWCWLIRFANESVIPSYRDHPDHVAYANEQFRPIAGNRVSIDYTLLGPESNS